MDILVRKENGILTIEFDRLDKRNAFTLAMYKQLADAILDGEEDKAIRVILFCGKPEIFSAGNDLIDFLNAKEDFGESPVARFLHTLSVATKPVMAAVTGAAIGIGTTMLMHCDLIYAADNAKFSMPFTKLALCPEFASSFLLPRNVGYQRAAELLFFGEEFTAQEAFEMGFVNKVLPPSELLPFAYKQAAKLTALPAASLRLTKSLMKDCFADRVANQIMVEGKQFNARLLAPEAKEAFKAFAEKRKPDYTKFD